MYNPKSMLCTTALKKLKIKFHVQVKFWPHVNCEKNLDHLQKVGQNIVAL